MSNNLPRKEWSSEKEVEDRHPRKKDPRVRDTRDEDSSSYKEEGIQQAFSSSIDNVELTDLDVAYSILFEDANNEYIKEKDKKKESKQKGKAAIPQRVFSSFLASIENDVMEYVSACHLLHEQSSNIVHHTQLIKEEGKVKTEIDSIRKDVVNVDQLYFLHSQAKNKRSNAQRAVFELQEKRNRIAHV